MSKYICENCTHFIPNRSPETEGTCVRYPPQWIGGHQTALEHSSSGWGFPITIIDDTCGEFTEAEEPNTSPDRVVIPPRRVITIPEHPSHE